MKAPTTLQNTFLARWLGLNLARSEGERQLLLLLYSLLSLIALISSSVAVTLPQAGNADGWQAAGAALISLTLFVLVRLGFGRMVAWLLPLSVLLMASYIMAANGGILDAAAFVFPGLIVLSGLLLGRRGLVTFTLLSLAALAAIGLAQLNGLVAATEVSFSPLRLAAMLFLTTMMGFINYLFASIFDRNLTLMQQGEAELAERNRRLKMVQDSLEEQVLERSQRAEQALQEAEFAREALENQIWVANSLAQLSDQMRGEQNLRLLAGNVIRQLCQTLDAQVGALFLLEGERLQMTGSYAYTYRKDPANGFRLGEGLVGQAALERQPIVIERIPPDYMTIYSGLVSSSPHQILAAPFFSGEQVAGVVEVGSLLGFNADQVEFLRKALESVGIAFVTAQNRERINQLLFQTQQQAAELQQREEQLSSANVELLEQAEALRASQLRLQNQQQALEAANAELEEKAQALQEQSAALDQQNRELKTAQDALVQKADELAQASKYKSEFLANMSHELRTPLNSLLILARLLAQNEQGNLTPEQLESAQIIHRSGHDLLNLINEILDLAKVEAGKMQFYFAPASLAMVAQSLRNQFEHVALDKGLTFDVQVSPELPETVETDWQRAQQILKNLLGNAFKFTPKGSVKLLFERAELAGKPMLALRVVDSGIGMSAEQQKKVFEAFQQADGSTSRKYGGTGLGLTISRELAARLGGSIEMSSELGKGSVFSLNLPLAGPGPAAVGTPPATDSAAPAAVQPPAVIKTAIAAAAPVIAKAAAAPPPPEILDAPPPPLSKPASLQDDRQEVRRGDRVLLVIEDDLTFARILYDYAHKKNFKCLLAADGESGLDLLSKHMPDAVLLDLKLPGMGGLQVLEAIKENPAARHIPVHILSASSESKEAYQMGAIGFLTKPVSSEHLDQAFVRIEDLISRQIKNLLLVEDDSGLRQSVRQLLGGSDIKISEAPLGAKALELLANQRFDCMILDLTLPDMSGFDLLERLNNDQTLNRCPVIVYTGKTLSEEENSRLLKYTHSIIIKGARSPERLLDETALFLHRVVSDLPSEKQQVIRSLHDRDAVLTGKHILVVDDDMRGAFALSHLLGSKGLRVTLARSGPKALETLETVTDINLILMDIMMPEMDGYETTRRIRAQVRFRDLPILALTANAMKGDQEKCIAAGANDYLPKPVDDERLFSMLRVWLYQ